MISQLELTVYWLQEKTIIIINVCTPRPSVVQCRQTYPESIHFLVSKLQSTVHVYEKMVGRIST